MLHGPAGYDPIGVHMCNLSRRLVPLVKRFIVTRMECTSAFLAFVVVPLRRMESPLSEICVER